MQKTIIKNTLHTLKIIAGSVFIMIGSYYAINKSDGSVQEQTFNKIMGWIGILFFGTGAILGIYKLITNKPQLVIDNLGVWKPSSIFSKYKEEDVVKWNEIRNISVEKNNSYVYIETKDDLLEIKIKESNLNVQELLNLIDKKRKVS